MNGEEKDFGGREKKKRTRRSSILKRQETTCLITEYDFDDIPRNPKRVSFAQNTHILEFDSSRWPYVGNDPASTNDENHNPSHAIDAENPVSHPEGNREGGNEDRDSQVVECVNNDAGISSHNHTIHFADMDQSMADMNKTCNVMEMSVVDNQYSCGDDMELTADLTLQASFFNSISSKLKNMSPSRDQENIPLVRKLSNNSCFDGRENNPLLILQDDSRKLTENNMELTVAVGGLDDEQCSEINDSPQNLRFFSSQGLSANMLSMNSLLPDGQQVGSEDTAEQAFPHENNVIALGKKRKRLTDDLPLRLLSPVGETSGLNSSSWLAAAQTSASLNRTQTAKEAAQTKSILHDVLQQHTTSKTVYFGSSNTEDDRRNEGDIEMTRNITMQLSEHIQNISYPNNSWLVGQTEAACVHKDDFQNNTVSKTVYFGSMNTEGNSGQGEDIEMTRNVTQGLDVNYSQRERPFQQTLMTSFGATSPALVSDMDMELTKHVPSSLDDVFHAREAIQENSSCNYMKAESRVSGAINNSFSKSPSRIDKKDAREELEKLTTHDDDMELTKTVHGVCDDGNISDDEVQFNFSGRSSLSGQTNIPALGHANNFPVSGGNFEAASDASHKHLTFSSHSSVSRDINVPVGAIENRDVNRMSVINTQPGVTLSCEIDVPPMGFKENISAVAASSSHIMGGQQLERSSSNEGYRISDVETAGNNSQVSSISKETALRERSGNLVNKYISQVSSSADKVPSSNKDIKSSSNFDAPTHVESRRTSVQPGVSATLTLKQKETAKLLCKEMGKMLSLTKRKSTAFALPTCRKSLTGVYSKSTQENNTDIYKPVTPLLQTNNLIDCMLNKTKSASDEVDGDISAPFVRRSSAYTSSAQKDRSIASIHSALAPSNNSVYLPTQSPKQSDIVSVFDSINSPGKQIANSPINVSIKQDQSVSSSNKALASSSSRDLNSSGVCPSLEENDVCASTNIPNSLPPASDASTQNSSSNVKLFQLNPSVEASRNVSFNNSTNNLRNMSLNNSDVSMTMTGKVPTRTSLLLADCPSTGLLEQSRDNPPTLVASLNGSKIPNFYNQESSMSYKSDNPGPSRTPQRLCSQSSVSPKSNNTEPSSPSPHQDRPQSQYSMELEELTEDLGDGDNLRDLLPTYQVDEEDLLRDLESVMSSCMPQIESLSLQDLCNRVGFKFPVQEDTPQTARVEPSNTAEILHARLNIVPKVDSLQSFTADQESKIDKMIEMNSEAQDAASWEMSRLYSQLTSTSEDNSGSLSSSLLSMLEACRATAHRKWHGVATDELLNFLSARENALKELKKDIDCMAEWMDEMDSCIQTIDSIKAVNESVALRDSELRATNSDIEKLRGECSEMEAMKESVSSFTEDLMAQQKKTETDQLAVEDNIDWFGCLTEWSHMYQKLLGRLNQGGQELTFGFFFNTMVLKVGLGDSETVTNTCIKSRLSKNSKPWAKLSHSLAMASINIKRLQDGCTTWHNLPKALQTVSEIVCRCRQLSQEIRQAHFTYRVTVSDWRLTIQMLDRKKRQKIALSTLIEPPCRYVDTKFTWLVTILMGNVSQEKITTVAESITPGPKYLTRVLEASHDALCS